VAQQDNAPNKPVHLMYLIGAVVLFYLLQWSIDWVWGYFTTSPSDFTITMIAAVGATVTSIAFYKNDRVFQLANEVASELKKVTWPTAKEVRAQCRDQAKAQGLKGDERKAAVNDCFAKARPDLAAKQKCREEGKAKGLANAELKAYVKSCKASAM